MFDIIHVPVEIYSIIFSYTDCYETKHFEEVPEFTDIHQNTNFWVTLLNYKFSKYIKPNIQIKDFKDLYLGLCTIDGYDTLSEYFYLYDNSPETLKYLFRTKQIKLKKSQLLVLILIVDEPDIFDMYITQIINDVYYENIYDELISNPYLKPKIFEHIFKLAELPNDFKKLVDAAHRTSDIDNIELSDYIIERLLGIENKEILYNYFIENIDEDVHYIKKLWEKYSHLFTPSEIYELNERFPIGIFR
jgi:hypothetical protein